MRRQLVNRIRGEVIRELFSRRLQRRGSLRLDSSRGRGLVLIAIIFFSAAIIENKQQRQQADADNELVHKHSFRTRCQIVHQYLPEPAWRLQTLTSKDECRKK